MLCVLSVSGAFKAFVSRTVSPFLPQMDSADGEEKTVRESYTPHYYCVTLYMYNLYCIYSN